MNDRVGAGGQHFHVSAIFFQKINAFPKVFYLLDFQITSFTNE